MVLRSVVLALLSGVVLSAHAQSSNYCVAIRGNGELQPAHWGAMAKLIEDRGFPQKMAGGSSGSLTMFLADSIASNPYISAESPLSAGLTEEQKRSLGALMFKSLHGVVNFIAESKQVQSAKNLKTQVTMVQQSISQGAMSTLEMLAQNGSISAIKSNREDVLKLISELKKVGILSSGKYQDVIGSIESILNGSLPKISSFRMLRFYITDLRTALATFGAFDAESDKNLFFREGIVDFRKFAFEYGKIASFYAGSGWSEQTQLKFDQFAAECNQQEFVGMTWDQIIRQRPNCQLLLNQALSSYLSQNLDWNQFNVVNRPIGKHIVSFPTTSVLIGSEYEAAKKVMDAYHMQLDRSLSEAFQVKDVSKVKFGYWGPESELKLISDNLKSKSISNSIESMDVSKDPKSQKFLALGEANWIEALRLSPAEPGLASLQLMKVKGVLAYSAGGWSDLHPVPVLRASGCQDVVYVTRKGGEAIFGQGIAKRLLNLNRDWSLLSTKDAETKARNVQINNQGDSSDMTSDWSLLYNSANPNSSLIKSIRLANSVVCTNWNSFDVTKGQLVELIEESYRAPEIRAEDRSRIRVTQDMVGCL